MQKDLRHLFIGGVLFRLAADASLVSTANHFKIQQSKQRNMCVCLCVCVDQCDGNAINTCVIFVLCFLTTSISMASHSYPCVI